MGRNTTDLLDAQTKAKVNVPDHMVLDALKGRAFKISPENVYEGAVGMLDPESREVHRIPTDQIAQHLKNGWKLESTREAHKHRLGSEYGDAALAAGAFLTKGTGTMTAGGSTYGLTKLAGIKPDALAALEEMSPMATALGSVAGTVAGLGKYGAIGSKISRASKLQQAKGISASADIGAALGKGAVTAMAPMGVVSRAVTPFAKGASTMVGARGYGLGQAGAKAAELGIAGAVEGAGYAVGELVHESALGNANLTAETVWGEMKGGSLMGAGIGAGFGLASPLVGGIAGTVGEVGRKSLAKHRAAAEEFATDKDPVEGLMKALQGRYTFEAMEPLKKHTKTLEKYGREMPWKDETKIKKWLSSHNLATVGDDIDSILVKSEDLTEEMGHEIGKVYTKLDELAGGEGGFPLELAVEQIERELAGKGKNLGVKGYENAVREHLEEILEKYSYEEGGRRIIGNMPHTRANEAMQEYAKKAKYQSTAQETDMREASKFLRGVFNHVFETTAEPILREGGEATADMFLKWQKLKPEYGRARFVVDTLRDTAAGQGSRPGAATLKQAIAGSVTSVIGGGIGSMWGPLGIMAGTSIGAAIGGAGSAGARRWGPSVMAGTFGKLSQVKAVKDGSITALYRKVRGYVTDRGATTVGAGGLRVSQKPSLYGTGVAAKKAAERVTGLKGAELGIPLGVKMMASLTFDPQSPVPQLDESDVEAATRLSKQLASLKAKPEVVAERITAGLAELEGVAPETAKAVAALEVRKIQHLQDVALKYSYAGSTLQPMAYQDDYINKTDAEKFGRSVSATIQPIPSLFAELDAGAVMPETINAISTVYPTLMEKIRLMFREAFAESTTPIPYATNTAMAALMQEATTRDLTSGFQARHQALWGGERGSGMPTMKGVKSSRAAEGARQKNLRPSTDRTEANLTG